MRIKNILRAGLACMMTCSATFAFSGDFNSDDYDHAWVGNVRVFGDSCYLGLNTHELTQGGDTKINVLTVYHPAIHGDKINPILIEDYSHIDDPKIDDKYYRLSGHEINEGDATIVIHTTIPASEGIDEAFFDSFSSFLLEKTHHDHKDYVDCVNLKPFEGEHHDDDDDDHDHDHDH